MSSLFLLSLVRWPKETCVIESLPSFSPLASDLGETSKYDLVSILHLFLHPFPLSIPTSFPLTKIKKVRAKGSICTPFLFFYEIKGTRLRGLLYLPKNYSNSINFGVVFNWYERFIRNYTITPKRKWNITYKVTFQGWNKGGSIFLFY